MTIGIGILGCGAVSRMHMKAFLQWAGLCEVRAVYDIDSRQAERLARWEGASAEVCASWEDLLARDDIHAISVCTPPDLHRGPVIEALRAGKHVLCEKPLAPSLDDCDAMIAAARENGRLLGVAMQTRFNRDYERMKRVLDSGALGPLRFAQLNATYWRGERYYEAPWRGTWERQSGGVAINQALHALDVFVWLLGEVESVQADMETVQQGIEVEDVAMAMLRFRGGLPALFGCSVNAVRSEIRMDISGYAKAVSYPLGYHALLVRDGASVAPVEAAARELERIGNGSEQAGNQEPGDVHIRLMNDFLRAIAEKREPAMNGAQGRRVIEVITAIYKSASTGERVQLPIDTADPWYTTAGILKHVRRAR
ncbi:MAG: oxidoreductase domain protein [Paenibacillus sp.]|jgi:predicted dehydrogenase|uniref:Gfo/Idh/MocA family protein n=1 Tax=Paenibacillus sp. GCM10012303 TaxID=3317340 RepID=UPI0029F16372|nr:oxidoreductase domain protein [Paenibacillus sp.]